VYELVRAKAEAEGQAKGRAEGQAKGWAEGQAKGWAEGQAKGRAEGRAEGEMIGIIHICERLLNRPETPTDQLAGLSLEELNHLGQELQGLILKTNKAD
jgi:flagellar biosynthesis/type III secretory pathway protein FliH